MRWLVVAVAMVGLVACSGGEDRGETAGSSAQHGDSDAAGTMGKAVEGMVDPKVGACLDKVRAGDLTAAYPICLEAAKIDPDNNEVTRALARAKASLADAEAEGRAALDSARKGADEAMGDAHEQADDAMKALTPPKMP